MTHEERCAKIRKIQSDDVFQDRCLTCFQHFVGTKDVEMMIDHLPKDLCGVILSYLLPNTIYPYCNMSCYNGDENRYHRCIQCYINLTEYNPRQYCGKTYCLQKYPFASDPDEIQKLLR